MSSLLDRLIKAGNLPLFQAYKSRSAFDFGGQGNHGSLIDSIHTGAGLRFPSSTSHVLVNDNTSIRLTEGTLIGLGQFNKQTTTETLFDKHDVTDINYKFYLSSSAMNFTTSGGASFIAANTIGKKYLAVDFENGSKPEFWTDGYSIGLGNVISTISENDADLIIANRYDFTERFKSIVSNALIINRKLTASEHAELYAELQSLVWPTKTTFRGAYKSTVKAYDPSLVGGYEMRLQDGEIKDQSGNGNDGIISGTPPTEIDTPVGPGLNWVAGRANLGAGFQEIIDVTVACWVKFDNVSAYQRCWGYYLSSADRWGLQISAGDIAILDDIDNAGSPLYPYPAAANTWYRIIAVMDSLENKLYINGILVGSGAFASADWSSFAGLLFAGEWSAAGTSFLQGTLAGTLQVFNEAKSSDWVKQDYQDDRFLRGMRTAWMTQYGAYESSEAVTAGYLENTPFQVLSGSHKVIVETAAPKEGMKSFENVVAGDIFLNTSVMGQSEDDAAYGEWNITVLKALDANTMRIFFIADDSVPTVGYSLQLRSDESVWLVETGGANQFTTAPGYFNNGEYLEFKIVRTKITGTFTVYLNGVLIDPSGGTGSNPVTNNNITTSKKIVINKDAGDKFAIADLAGNHAFVKTID